MPNTVDSLAKLPPDRMGLALELIDYMLGDALRAGDADIVLTNMSERIFAAGVPLDRATSIVPLSHAEAVTCARFWEPGKGVRSYSFSHRPDTGESYGRSPAAEAYETGQWVTLWLPETSEEKFNIVKELKEDGFIHYVMMPVFMANGLSSTFSFATRDFAGFSKVDFAFFRAVFPALAACQEILTTHRILGAALSTYVGVDAQKRILAGDIHRGDVMRIRSAILFADMRDYTGLSGGMEAEDVTAMLNDYFDCIVPAIEENGGEVLKYMGDGILAIFRDDGDVPATCARALAAARVGLQQVDAYAGEPKFRAGIALHFGEVGYGNIGSGQRLDYTVVGRDANVVARLADLCGTLKKVLLVSEIFQAQIGSAKFRSVGQHTLKGVKKAVDVFVQNG